MKQSKLPGIVENCEAAVCRSSMSGSCKEPYVHAVTRKNRGRHHSLCPVGTPDSQPKLVFLVPKS